MFGVFIKTEGLFSEKIHSGTFGDEAYYEHIVGNKLIGNMSVNVVRLVKNSLAFGKGTAYSVGNGNNFPLVNVYNFPKVMLLGCVIKLFSVLEIINAFKLNDLYFFFNKTRQNITSWKKW